MDPPPVPEPAAQAAAEEAPTGSAVTNGIVDAAPGEASGSVAAANPELSISHVTAEAKRPEEPNEADASPEAAEEAIADAPAESRAEEHAAPDDASAQPSLMDVEPPADSQPALKSETTVDALEAPEAANNAAPASPSSDDVGALFDLEAPASVEVYDMSNYTFGKKELEARGYLMRLESARAQESHLKTRYGERGQRRSVAGVLLVHSHRFPLLLLLQRADGRGPYALPGGRLRLGESAEAGLARKLRKHLTPEGGDEDAPELDIGERLSTWYRIDFSPRFYPYVPAHVTKPKEETHVHMVSLPEKFAFSVPKNMQLIGVPFYEMFNNPDEFGNVIASLPALISRFHKNYC